MSAKSENGEDDEEVVGSLGPTGPIPGDEWQVRELVPLKDQPQAVREPAARCSTVFRRPVVRHLQA